MNLTLGSSLGEAFDEANRLGCFFSFADIEQMRTNLVAFLNGNNIFNVRDLIRWFGWHEEPLPNHKHYTRDVGGGVIALFGYLTVRAGLPAVDPYGEEFENPFARRQST